MSSNSLARPLHENLVHSSQLVPFLLISSGSTHIRDLKRRKPFWR